MPGGLHALSGPQAAALPARLRIVDAAVEAARVETAERIRHAHHHPLAFVPHEERIRAGAGDDRRVVAQPECVVPVDPVQVVRIGAARVGHTFEIRPRRLIKRPALGAVLSRGSRPVEHLALPAIEAGEMSAVERGPDDARAPIHVDAVHAVGLDLRVRVHVRRLVDF